MSGGPEVGRPRDAAEAVAERDAIQANLLELDDSFVKRMLEGAAQTVSTVAVTSVTAANDRRMAATAVVSVTGGRLVPARSRCARGAGWSGSWTQPPVSSRVSSARSFLDDRCGPACRAAIRSITAE
jgi:hypothetical protein